MAKSVHYHVKLSAVQKTTIAVTVLFIFAVAAVTKISPAIQIGVLGLFLQLLGTVLLGLGLVKTNDEIAELVGHHEKLNKQQLISHLTKDRFFMVTGVFLIVLGLLLQIISRS